MARLGRGSFILLCTLVAACGGPSSPPVNSDAGSDGGTLPDAGEVDAGEVDAGEPDAGEVDAGEVDAGEPDAGEPDAGEPDAGEPDAGELDAGEPDAGEPDAGEPDAGEPDAGEPDAGEPDAGVFVPADGGPSRVEWVRWVDSQPRTNGEVDAGGTNLYPALPRGLALGQGGEVNVLIQGGVNTYYWPLNDGGVEALNDTTLVQLAPTGEWLAQSRIIDGPDTLRGIAVGADGGLHVAGNYSQGFTTTLHNPTGGSQTLAQPSGASANSTQGVLATFGQASPPPLHFSMTFGGAQWDEIRDVAFNAATDAIIITGYYTGSSVTLGVGTTVTVACGGGNWCFYVAAVNTAGGVLWMNNIERNGSAHVNSEGMRVAVDDLGNVYVFGTIIPGSSAWISGADAKFYQNPLLPTVGRTAGTDVILSGDPQVGFLAKYSSSGALLWAIPFGKRTDSAGNPGLTAVDMAVNGSTGQIVLVGGTGTGTFQFDPADPAGIFPSVVNHTQPNKGWMASYDTNGLFQWVMAPGVPLTGNKGVLATKAVAIDQAGNIYAAGWVEGRTRFGDFSVENTYTSLFVASYDSSGNARWVEATSDKQGDFIASGYFSGTNEYHLAVDPLGTSAFLAAAYNRAGLKVGAFTAPPLLTNESSFIVRLRADVP
jgi:hypothetical protein